MFEIDDELIHNLLISKLITKFNMISKIHEYSQSPNSSVEIKENSITFSKWDDKATTLESFRVIMYYGVSGMQYSQNEHRIIINFRSFPDGNANWDRNIVIHAQKVQKEYKVTIMVITSEELTDIKNIQSTTCKQINLNNIQKCLKMIEEEIDPTSYALFVDHLQDLETIFARDLDPQQLSFTNFKITNALPDFDSN